MNFAPTQPDTPPAGKRGETRLIAALLAFAALTRIPFAYHFGFGDPDAVGMAAGIAHALSPGVPVREAAFYNVTASPGWSYLVLWVYGHLLGGMPAGTMAALTVIGVTAGILLAWPLYLLLRQRFRPAVAAAGTVVVLLAPQVWELGTSFHPVVVVVPLLMTAALVFRGSGTAAPGPWRMAATLVLLLLALNFRTDMVLVFPALLLAAWFMPNRWKSLIAATILMVLSTLGIWLTVKLVVGSTTPVAAALAENQKWFWSVWRWSGVAPWALWTAFDMGVATVLLTVGLTIRWLAGWRGHSSTDGDCQRGIAVALLALGVVLIYWGPNYAGRRYLVMMPALVWILAELLLSRAGRRVLLTAAVLIPLANLLVPEALYAGWNATHPGNPKTPVGSFFSWHRRRVALQDRCRSVAEDVVSWCRAGAGVTERGTGGSRAALVLVNWEVYLHLLYRIALQPPPYSWVEEPVFVGSARIVGCRIGDAEVCILIADATNHPRVPTLTPGGREALEAEARRLVGPGCAIWAPQAVVSANLLPPSPQARITGY